MLALALLGCRSAALRIGDEAVIDTGNRVMAHGHLAEAHPMPTVTPDSASPPDYDATDWPWGPEIYIPLQGDYGEGFSIAVADLNLDGSEDYVVHRYHADDVEWSTTDLVVFLGPRSGSVSAGDWDLRQGRLTDGPERIPDVDGDGADDILLPHVGVFTAAQLLGSTPLTEVDAVAWGWPEEQTIGDANGDGAQDAGGYSAEGGWADTGGSLSTWVYIESEPDTAGHRTYLASVSEYPGTARTMREDWHLTSDRDGDGIREIWANPGDGLWRLYSSAGLMTGAAELMQTASGGAWGCNAGDLDGDAVEDLVVASAGGLVAVLATDGDVDTSLLPAALPTSGTLDAPERVDDLDGDGLADFVATASGGVHEGMIRVSGAVVMAGGVVDITSPDWLLEPPDAWVYNDPDGRSVWEYAETPDRGLTRPARIPLSGNPGVVTSADADLSFEPSMPVLGSTEVAVRWWLTDAGATLVVLGRAAPYGVALVPLDELQRGENQALNTWWTWQTDGPVGWMPDLDHDGEPEVLLQTDAGVTRWSLDFQTEFATVEEGVTTDLVTWTGGTFCDLDGDGIDDPITSSGPVSGASVLDEVPGITLLLALPELAGCIGDVDGDGVGDLTTVETAEEGRIYSGADGRVLHTYPYWTWAGTGVAVDVDGDGRAEIPWLDQHRAGWLWAWPTPTPNRMDFARGTVGGTDNLRMYPVSEETFCVESNCNTIGCSETQLSFYATSPGWQWWGEHRERDETNRITVLDLSDDPEADGRDVIITSVGDPDTDRDLTLKQLPVP